MYFNENKEDTNIDEEFKKTRKLDFDFERYRRPIIIIGAIILLLIIILIIVGLAKNKTKYYIDLNEPIEMTIGKDSVYTEPGYNGYDNKNRTYDVTVNGEVDTSQAGTYEITYTLHNTTKKRIVKVIDTPDKPTNIHINGGKNITIELGSKYEELGYSAIDFVDGDLTSQVKVSGTVNTNKKGIYRLTYTVTNSKGITTVETRVVTVE